MRKPQELYRSVSSIIGGIFVVIIIMLFMWLALATIDRMYSYIENMANRLESLVEINNIVNCMDSYWIYMENKTYIHIENGCGETVLLTGIAIVFRDGSYIIASRINKTFANTSLPYPLPLGKNITISINTIDKPIVVSISIATSSASTAISVKELKTLFYLYPPNP